MKQTAATVEASSSTQATDKRRRMRWWQFRLRTLLVIATIASVAFATVGVRWQRHRSMKRNIAALNSHGATTVLALPPPRYPWIPEPLAEPRDLIVVDCRRGPGDLPLELLADFSSIQILYVPGAAISPAGLQAVARQSNLVSLDLSNSTVGDDDLRFLENLTHLSQLCLSGTQVTGAGMRHVAKLRSLEVLQLDNTAISNDAVDSLRSLPRLETLSVSGTAMTDEGVQKLEASIEGLMVLDD